MPEYDDTNRGVLFKNERKTTDKHPDYTGKINVGGKNFSLAAWIREGKRGKFMSLSVSTIEEQRAAAPREQIDVDQDIPF